MVSSGSEIGTAFGLVILAALCAPLGACVTAFVNKSNTVILSCALGLAAGVMVFISLSEVRWCGLRQQYDS